MQVAATVPELDRSLESNGERQGVQRVLSALQAHMWPGLTRKESTADASHPREANEVESAQLSSRPLAEQEIRDTAPDARAGEDLESQQQGARQSGNGAMAREEEVPRTDEELEADMEQFESLMREVASARGRLQGMPDAERRTAAEALTMRLMSQFGIDDDSDSGSDGV